MRDTETINVYWSPVTTWEVEELGEWNMLYPDPVSLFTDLQRQKMPNAGVDTYFSCPATNDKFKKTYVFRNDLASSYEFDYTNENPENNWFMPKTENYVGFSIQRPPTIAKGPLINFNLFYSFFADESLEAIFTPPMLHEPRHTRYGTCIPGQFDIGQWFRPYPMEMQMWNTQGEFHLEEQEPLFYVEFKTPKKIKLQRYKMNGAISSYLKACSNSKKTWGAGVSLQKRYTRFNESRMRELILKEIRANLLDDEL